MNNKLRSALVTLAVTAVISSGMVTSAAATHVAGPAPSGSVVHVLKNSNCGWGITTMKYSCARAYSVILKWVIEADYPSSMDDVFNPDSFGRFDVKCSGTNTVTCKNNKGSVKFKPAKIPQQVRCVSSEFDPDEIWGYAWLNSSCELAAIVTQSFTEDEGMRPTYSTHTLIDPANGRPIEFVCFNVGESYWPAMCLSGKKVVVIGE